jgi:uncharacterized beta-barrel protein YwiB (DUF1934 family)
MKNVPLAENALKHVQLDVLNRSDDLKKDVLISIKGTQTIDDHSETTELTTQGVLIDKEGKYFIIYDESEATGFNGSKTTLKLEGDNKVTIIRNGKTNSELIVESEKRNIGHYDTGYGEMMLGVSADKIESNINKNGGDLYFKYVLDINSAMVSENEVSIKVRGV